MSDGVAEDVPAVCFGYRQTLGRAGEPGSAVAALEAAGPGRAK